MPANASRQSENTHSTPWLNARLLDHGIHGIHEKDLEGHRYLTYSCFVATAESFVLLEPFGKSEDFSTLSVSSVFSLVI